MVILMPETDMHGENIVKQSQHASLRGFLSARILLNTTNSYSTCDSASIDLPLAKYCTKSSC